MPSGALSAAYLRRSTPLLPAGSIGCHVRSRRNRAPCSISVEVLSRYLYEQELMAVVLKAAGHLAKEHAAALSDAGACEAVVQVLNAYAHQPSTLWWYLNVVADLAQHDDVRGRLCAADPGPAVIRAMQLFPPVVKVQMGGILAITPLTRSGAYSRQLADIGSREVMTAIELALSSPHTVAFGLAGLAVLAEAEGFSDRLGPACAGAVAAVDAYADLEAIAKTGVLAISHLANATANLPLLRQCGALETVTAAVQRYPQNEDILIEASAVLAKLGEEG
ncbi:hypothetical protein JKP88DRAFT_266567 [Tribonema minus]|uniref:Uncharacterized protein n=1 Tax=Tribonema minus TaxID=303371 RepID=A0A835ZEK9_9STRA|nr:hypothetical protein JKP88DRAFT_266567 [Tribonema minus]